jgi:hypothetical protein
MTEEIVLYPGDQGVVFVSPTGDIPVEEVARKDVPAGVPYRIVNRADMPSDFLFWEAWIVDFSTPDGYGIGAEAWFAEQEL